MLDSIAILFLRFLRNLYTIFSYNYAPPGYRDESAMSAVDHRLVGEANKEKHIMTVIGMKEAKKDWLRELGALKRVCLAPLRDNGASRSWWHLK